MRYRLMVVAALVVSCCVGLSYGRESNVPSEVTTSPSPDGSLVAIVTYFHRAGAPGESRVELQTRSGQRLAQWSYLSEHGQHGYAVAKAQWTPDSQFFVYSLQASGNRRPWHSPVQYFSRKEHVFVGLDDALIRAVTNTEFGIGAPDEVAVDLYPNKYASISVSRLEAERTVR